MAHEGRTAVCISSTSLSIDGLAPIFTKPGRERLPSIVDIIGHTFRVRARIIAVEVLVHC